MHHDYTLRNFGYLLGQHFFLPDEDSCFLVWPLSPPCHQFSLEWDASHPGQLLQLIFQVHMSLISFLWYPDVNHLSTLHYSFGPLFYFSSLSVLFWGHVFSQTRAPQISPIVSFIFTWLLPVWVPDSLPYLPKTSFHTSWKFLQSPFESSGALNGDDGRWYLDWETSDIWKSWVSFRSALFCHHQGIINVPRTLVIALWFRVFVECIPPADTMICALAIKRWIPLDYPTKTTHAVLWVIRTLVPRRRILMSGHICIVNIAVHL